MGNQQERLLSPGEIAMLLVGEGHFGLGVNMRRNNRFSVVPSMAISMTDIETMEILANSLRALNLPHHQMAKDQRKNGWKAQTLIRVWGIKRMRRFLDVLLPYLTGKKLEAAQAVSDYIDSRLSGEQRDELSEFEINCIERVRQANGGFKGHSNDIKKMRELNAVPRITSGSKTHCVNGHPLSGDNLFEHEGRRRCKICRRKATREAYHRMKDKQNPQRPYAAPL